jgi:hypothetical protein
MKQDVGKTVGGYERPARPKWLKLAAAIAVLILLVLAAIAASRFFGEAQAATPGQAVFDEAGKRALSYLLFLTPPEPFSGALARSSP